MKSTRKTEKLWNISAIYSKISHSAMKKSFACWKLNKSVRTKSNIAKLRNLSICLMLMHAILWMKWFWGQITKKAGKGARRKRFSIWCGSITKILKFPARRCQLMPIRRSRRISQQQAGYLSHCHLKAAGFENPTGQTGAGSTRSRTGLGKRKTAADDGEGGCRDIESAAGGWSWCGNELGRGALILLGTILSAIHGDASADPT